MPTNDTAERTRTTGMDKVTTATNVVTTAGAILVVGLGLTFVFIIAIVALGTLPKDQGAAVVTAALTVLGTIVGAYFGVKVGAAGRERAEAARDVESVKVQELAARVDPETAKAALDTAHRRSTQDFGVIPPPPGV